MKNTTIARRYAKALMLIGKEDGKAEDYGKELDSFASLLKREEMLSFAISNPLYDTLERKNVLQAILEKTNFSKIIKTFLILLFEKGRISYLVDINEFYQKFLDEFKGIVRADITFAMKPSSEETEKIKNALSKKTGKEVILNLKEDENIIGGVVAKIGDLVLDGSIKTQLLKMKETLKGDL